MVKQWNNRERNSLIDILPSDAAKLNDDVIIAVSRICVNKRIMEIRHLSKQENPDVEKLLSKALSKARGLERNRTGSVAYIKLTVGEAKIAFNPLEKMPSNSIKLVAEIESPVGV